MSETPLTLEWFPCIQYAQKLPQHPKPCKLICIVQIKLQIVPHGPWNNTYVIIWQILFICGYYYSPICVECLQILFEARFAAAWFSTLKAIWLQCDCSQSALSKLKLLNFPCRSSSMLERSQYNLFLRNCEINIFAMGPGQVGWILHKYLRNGNKTASICGLLSRLPQWPLNKAMTLNVFHLWGLDYLVQCCLYVIPWELLTFYSSRI